MDFTQYQQLTHTTAGYPEDVAVLYTALGLVGEAGEIANKVKKVIRDDGGRVTPERRAAVLEELGDVLWYISELCTALDADLGEVAANNIAKLQSRQARGVIRGDGDKR